MRLYIHSSGNCHIQNQLAKCTIILDISLYHVIEPLADKRGKELSHLTNQICPSVSYALVKKYIFKEN